MLSLNTERLQEYPPSYPHLIHKSGPCPNWMTPGGRVQASTTQSVVGLIATVVLVFMAGGK